MNSTEHSPCWEASEQLPHIICNVQVHCHVHIRPSLVLTLSKTNPVHTLSAHFFLRSTSIFSFYLHPGIPSNLFPSGFPSQTLYVFLLPDPCWTSSCNKVDILQLCWHNIIWLQILWQKCSVHKSAQQPNNLPLDQTWWGGIINSTFYIFFMIKISCTHEVL